jgi:pimeloyl-ACP methyl ester carboxylesterase
MTPIVLASGQLLTPDVWAPQIAALSRGRQIVLADHTRDDTITGMAERLLAAAPPRFHLAAHAMGGFVAFEVMRRAPERVARLALLTTLAPNDGPAQTARRQGYIQLVENGQFDQVAEERIPMLLAPGRRDDPALTGAVRQMARDTGPEIFLRQQRAIMRRQDSRPGLPRIAAPTLIIWGEQDGITTAAHQCELALGIPAARLDTLSDCGHLATLEAPERVNALLSDWLSG